MSTYLQSICMTCMIASHKPRVLALMMLAFTVDSEGIPSWKIGRRPELHRLSQAHEEPRIRAQIFFSLSLSLSFSQRYKEATACIGIPCASGAQRPAWPSAFCAMDCTHVAMHAISTRNGMQPIHLYICIDICVHIYIYTCAWRNICESRAARSLLPTKCRDLAR